MTAWRRCVLGLAAVLWAAALPAAQVRIPHPSGTVAEIGAATVSVRLITADGRPVIGWAANDLRTEYATLPLATDQVVTLAAQSQIALPSGAPTWYEFAIATPARTERLRVQVPDLPGVQELRSLVAATQVTPAQIAGGLLLPATTGASAGQGLVLSATAAGLLPGWADLAAGGGGGGTWGSLSGTLSAQVDLAAALAAKAPISHTQAWSTITATPTTLIGYGITDAVGSSDSRLTDARTPSGHTQAWSTITATPTTLVGYGITDAVGSSDSRLTDARTPTGHNQPSSTISDSTTTGRAVLTAASAAAGRAALGAGPSILTWPIGITEDGVNLTAGTGRTLVVPEALQLTGSGMVCYVGTAPAGGSITWDLRRNGSTLYSTAPAIAAGTQWTTASGSTPGTLSATVTLAANDRITLLPAAVGITPGAGGFCYLTGVSP